MLSKDDLGKYAPNQSSVTEVKMDSCIAQYNNRSVIKILIAAGSDLNRADRNGDTIFKRALEIVDQDMFTYLVELGVDLETRSRYGGTILSWAVRMNMPDYVKHLIELGAKPAAAYLETASYKGFIDIVLILLNAGVVSNRALVHASSKGHTEVVRTLLGSTQSVMREHEYTALIEASQLGFYEIVKLLLEAGVKPNRTTRSGWTALSSATFYSHSDIVELLKKYGAVE